MGRSTVATVADLPPVSIEQGIKLVRGELSELGAPLLIVFQHFVARMFSDFRLNSEMRMMLEF